MAICRKCGSTFSRTPVIDGEKRDCSKRLYCLECSPFKSHNTRQLQKGPAVGEPFVCGDCGNTFLYDRSKGHKKDRCHTCYENNRRHIIKLRAIEYKGGCCQLCHYNRCEQSLHFHHVDPSQKEFRFQGNRSWETTRKELDKCILVCSNCHGEIHAGLVPEAVVLSCWKHSSTEWKSSEVVSNLKVAEIRNSCRICGADIDGTKRYCNKHGGTFRASRHLWPSTADLVRMVEETSYAAVARLLSVSDNAIRKRIKNHPECAPEVHAVGTPVR
jgi:hypothetical protein